MGAFVWLTGTVGGDMTILSQSSPQLGRGTNFGPTVDHIRRDTNDNATVRARARKY